MPCAFGIGLDQRHRAASVRPVRFEVAQRLASTGKKPQVAPYSGAMLAIVAGPRAAGSRGRAVEFDELADHALLAQHLGDGQHEVGGGDAFA
jgi:hypothetical protein